jgi:hypothetical protein
MSYKKKKERKKNRKRQTFSCTHTRGVLRALPRMVIKSRENNGLLCAGSALRWAESIQQQPKSIAKERPAYMQTPSALGLAWFTISSPLRFLFSFFFYFSSIRFLNNRSHHLLSWGGGSKYHTGIIRGDAINAIFGWEFHHKQTMRR